MSGLGSDLSLPPPHPQSANTVAFIAIVVRTTAKSTNIFLILHTSGLNIYRHELTAAVKPKLKNKRAQAACPYNKPKPE
jgi:hypothetical protein